jgi:hypothetical protein
VLTGSNRRHSPCKGDALPTELSTRFLTKARILHKAGPFAKYNVQALSGSSAGQGGARLHQVAGFEQGGGPINKRAHLG